MQSRVISMVLVFGLAVVLTGCGVRGSLETPKATPDPTASADSGQGKPEGEAPKAHKPFVLDGLLR
jgi:predicted small lipoprotein YifL